jgi:hypothetical protein
MERKKKKPQEPGEAIIEFFTSCTPGERLAALLMYKLVDLGLSDRVVKALEKGLDRDAVDDDPDGEYLVGVIHGVHLAAGNYSGSQEPATQTRVCQKHT